MKVTKRHDKKEYVVIVTNSNSREVRIDNFVDS